MTFGRVLLQSGHWFVYCEPHVRSRIRRVFPRMSQTASDYVELSDTPENARELLWFLQRYPMECADLAALERRSNQHVEQERRLAELLAGSAPPITVELGLPPREYQLPPAQMLEIRGGLLLADDVGVGKTVSGIVPMASPAKIPALVVCPPHLTRQWEAELKRFLPGRRIHRVRSGKVYDLIKSGRQRSLFTEFPEVIVISYFMLRTWAETLKGVIKYVVFDEAQQLRSRSSEVSKACEHIASAAAFRMGLTATPIYNYGSEFWCVVDTLIPDCLGSLQEFLREWCTAAPGGNSRLRDSKDFGAYLRREGIMLRRTRKDVGREIPPVQKALHVIDCDEKVLHQLEGGAVELAKMILAASNPSRFEAAGQFDLVMRQATGIAKAPYAAEFCRMLLENGEPKIAVFLWHRAVYDILVERLERKHNAPSFKTVLYSGSESPAEKAKAVDEFIEGEARVILISLRAGAGLDGLQKVCRTAVFGELDWSPGVHEQCLGRLARDGQSEPVMGYFLLSESGTDPIVAEINGVKREQIEGVRNPDAALVERIETGEHHLRRVARDLLSRRGIPLPETNVTELPPTHPGD